MKAHELLRAYDIFQRDDWNFQLNDSLIDDIRFSNDKSNKIPYRIKQAFYWLFVGGNKSIREAMGDGVKHRLSMFFYSLTRTKEQPDGYMNQGAIITIWCEDGQYIELVQPSVGRLLADFLEQDPKNPHAKKIAKEIERIGNRKDAHYHVHGTTA